MSAPPPDVDRRLRAIEDTLADLLRRTARLEQRAPSAASSASEAVAHEPLAAAASIPPEALSDTVNPAWLAAARTSIPALAGRALIVLAGAFLLRAVTEAGSLPRASGVTMGFVYAVAWLGVADHVAPRNAPSALVHGVTTVLVGLPLLWEASVRFQVITPGVTAGALALVIGLGIAVAWHRDMPGLAIVMTLAAAMVLPALAIATASPMPFAWLALALSVTSSMRAGESWRWLQWPSTAVAGILLIALLVRSIGPAPLASPASVLALAASWAVVGLWIGTGRVLRSGRAPSALDWWHAGGALVVGVGGSLIAASRMGRGLSVTIALAALLLAAASYAMSLALAGDRPDRRSTVLFLSSQALILVLMATPVVFAGTAIAFWLAVLAGLFSWLGARRYEPDILAHGALYALAAAAMAGLAGAMARGWFVSIESWPAYPTALWPVMAGAAIGLFGPRLATGGPGVTLTALARLLLAAVLVSALGTWLVSVAGPLVIATLPAPGPVAALRSVVIAVLAIVLVLAGTHPRGRALRRLAPLVLLCGGAKIVVEDLWRSGPMLLFVALACYGLALVTVSRTGRD